MTWTCSSALISFFKYVAHVCKQGYDCQFSCCWWFVWFVLEGSDLSASIHCFVYHHSHFFLFLYFLKNLSFHCILRHVIPACSTLHFATLDSIIHWFTHSVHPSWSSCSCLPPSSFVTLVYSLVSSANLSTLLWTPSSRLLMNIRKRVGPRPIPVDTIWNVIWNVCPIRISPIDHHSLLSPLEPLLEPSLHSTFHCHSCHWSPLFVFSPRATAGAIPSLYLPLP